jgi:DNA processing protein
MKVEGIDRKLAAQVHSFFRGVSASTADRWADDQLARAGRIPARILTIWDREYPTALRRIYDPPAIVFVRGAFVESDSRAIAVVGTRGPSSYGSQMASTFSEGLAGLGFTVVSGLARGIDTIAHTAALRAGGRSIAVIGSGLDVPYPPENRSLADRISGQGAVVSEYPMRTKPDAVNFPRRNRIVSGLALGTIVVETGIDGGAMITAAMALDQNREVFAVPGPVNTRRPSGTHRLIREGKAMLLERVEEVLVELGLAGSTPAVRPAPSEAVALNLFEQKLLDAVGDQPEHIDLLADRAGLSIADALVHLLSLEFKSLVRQHPGKVFSRA